MNRFSLAHIVYLIGIMATFSLIASVPCIGQAEVGTLSGTVFDTEGKPISGFTINLSPAFKISKTNENGTFTFTDVPAGQIQIMIPPQQFGGK